MKQRSGLIKEMGKTCYFDENIFKHIFYVIKTLFVVIKTLFVGKRTVKMLSCTTAPLLFKEFKGANLVPGS